MKESAKSCNMSGEAHSLWNKTHLGCHAGGTSAHSGDQWSKLIPIYNGVNVSKTSVA